jgi:hypothetical protein
MKLYCLVVGTKTFYYREKFTVYLFVETKSDLHCLKKMKYHTFKKLTNGFNVNDRVIPKEWNAKL